MPRRSFAGFAVLLLVLVVAPSAGGAADETSTWRISAAEAATAVVTLDAPVQIDAARVRRPEDRLGFIDIAGTFGGAIVRDADGRFRAAMLRIAESPYVNWWATSDDEGATVLPAGEYTVHVVGDGATTVAFPVVPDTHLPAVVAEGTAPVFSAARAEGTSGPATTEAVEVTLPLTPRSAVVAMAITDTDVRVAGTLNLCIVSAGPGASCAEAQPRAELVQLPTTDNTTQLSLYGYEGDFAAGSYDVRLEGVGVGVQAPRRVFALAVD